MVYSMIRIDLSIILDGMRFYANGDAPKNVVD